MKLAPPPGSPAPSQKLWAPETVTAPNRIPPSSDQKYLGSARAEPSPGAVGPDHIPHRWHLAATAAAALATSPEALGGLVIRDRPGPVRDALIALITELSGQTLARLPGTLDTGALIGGVDLVATLTSGTRVDMPDVLSRLGAALTLVPMAERMPQGTAAMIAARQDKGTAPPLVLLDEAAEPDEAAPEAITDRLAMAVSLDGTAHRDTGALAYGRSEVAKARKALARGIADGDAADVLTRLAAAMAIPSLRAPALALKLARTLAALDGAPRIEEPHIATAAALCLAPRARAMPGPEDQDQSPEPPPPDDSSDKDKDKGNQQEQGPLEDRVLEAVAAMLPDLMLTGARQRGGATSTGAGDRKRSATHGRPIRSRRGKPDGQRLDVFATLMTAAPWQKLRKQAAPDRDGLIVLPDDFRIKQYEQPSESVLIFLVDASGSQAAARMAEAKGAVELMLAEAYRRREKVALIAFRGTGAELLLPPTRSLLQAKRRLATLPGGGPTPLATALMAGRDLALQIRRRGATPYLVALTDGRGNVALSGEHGRAQAREDQASAARAIAAEGITAALIDTANRPQADAQDLARLMGARYLALPRADAHGINRAVRAGLDQ
ncbi:MAG: magnesium chelatase subunit D [Pseudomonadota bacterium]